MKSREIRTLLAIGASFIPVASAAVLPEHAALLLRSHAGFTEEDLSSARKGNRVVRMLDTQSRAEVAFAGVVRLPIPFEQYVRRARAGNLYRINDNLLQVGRFRETPSADDLKPLKFESYDLETKDNSSEASATAAATNKRVLTQIVEDYERTGTTFTGPLGAWPKPVDEKKYFEPMVRHLSHLRESFPAAYDYLVGYPNVPKRGADDYFLWKQLTFGLRPLTRLAQVGVWEHKREEIPEAVVVTKQIYANRYFNASFQIDYIIADSSDPVRPAVFVITFNRGTSEFLEGNLGRFIRPIVVSRTQAAAEKTLDQAKRDMEAEFGAGHHAANDASGRNR